MRRGAIDEKGRERVRSAVCAVGLLVALLPRPAWAGAVEEIEFCTGSAFSRRAGRESCAAEFAWGSRRTVCVPRAQWARWLADPEGAWPGCGRLRGRWQAAGFARNLPESARKELRLRFVVEGVVRRDAPPAAWRAAVERARDRVSRALEPGDPRGIARKLLLAENLPGSPQDLLRELGFVHLLTASGIHLYALQGMTEGALLRLPGAARSPELRLRSARVISHALWIAVWILSGMRPGLLRPWAVVALRTWARARGFRWRTGAPLAVALSFDLALALAAALGLAADGGGEAEPPWAPGRMHYALAVGGGILAMQAVRDRRGARPSPWREHAALALGSWWLTAVWDLASVGRLAVLTPVLSLLCLPLFSLGFYPALVVLGFPVALGQPGAWETALAGLARILDAAVVALGTAAARAGSLWHLDPAWTAAGATLATVVLIAGRRRRVAGLAVLAIALGVRAQGEAASRRALAGHGARGEQAWVAAQAARTIVQLDVGQGDAALVLAATGAGLIDTGSGRGASVARWAELLARHGVRRLDWVLLTHLDEDHAGGLPFVAATVAIACVQAPPGELRSAAGRALRAAVPGADFAGEGCVPYPHWLAESGRGRDEGARNGEMFGVLVPLIDGRAYLNFGDADARLERAALPAVRALATRHAPAGLTLKLSHHGSRHSSPAEWLAALRPREVWVSAGAGNRHGHPGIEVIARAVAGGARVRRTDAEGALRLESGAEAQVSSRPPSITSTSPVTQAASGLSR